MKIILLKMEVRVFVASAHHAGVLRTLAFVYRYNISFSDDGGDADVEVCLSKGPKEVNVELRPDTIIGDFDCFQSLSNKNIVRVTAPTLEEAGSLALDAINATTFPTRKHKYSCSNRFIDNCIIAGVCLGLLFLENNGGF